MKIMTIPERTEVALLYLEIFSYNRLPMDICFDNLKI